MSVDEAIFEWPYVMMKRLFYIFTAGKYFERL